MVKHVEVSDSEPEYEVEFISRAKVEGKGKTKRWLYFVKWKGYSQTDNTWEPMSNFQGSEHFVETFWEKVRDKRNWQDVSQFQDGEEILPTAPPPKKKVKSKIEPLPKPVSTVSVEIDSPNTRLSRTKPDSKSKPKSTVQPQSKSAATTRETQKRKFTELDEGNGTSASRNETSESEVQSIIATTPASRGRPRRRIDSDISQTRGPVKGEEIADSEKDTVSARPHRATTAVSATTPSKASTPARPRGRPRKTAKSASAAVAQQEGKIPRKRGRPRKSDKEIVKENVAPNDPQLLSDIDAPGETDDENGEAEDAMQVDTGAEADVEDEASTNALESSRVAQAETVGGQALVGKDLEEVPTSDVMEREEKQYEQEALTKGKQREEVEIQLTPMALPVLSSSKLPAHRARAANPRVKLIDDVGTGPSDGNPAGISTKARIARGLGQSQTNGSSSTSAKKPRQSSSRTKPGPGRSSSGLQLGSSSLLTVVKKGVLDTLRRVGVSSSTAQVPGELVPESEHEADFSDPPEFPTGEQLLHMAGLDKQAAGELPDFEETEAEAPGVAAVEENTAAGTPDIDVEEGDASIGVTRDMDKIVMTDEPETTHSEMHTTEQTEAETPVVSASGTVINKPGEAIGRSNSTDMVAWRQTTIFGPLSMGRKDPISPSPDSSNLATPSAHVLTLIFSSSAHLPVVLQDLQTPSTSDMKLLNEIATGTNASASGRFYKDDDAEIIVNALRANGSCGRVLQDTTADEEQRRNFDRFSIRLKEGELYLATVNVNMVAFCSSENIAASTKLRIPSNLIGLENTILASVVSVSNDNAYLNVAFKQDDNGW